MAESGPRLSTPPLRLTNPARAPGGSCIREHLRYVEDAVLGDGVLVELHGGRERDLGHGLRPRVYRG